MPTTTRSCMVVNDQSGKCLGHPSIDDERYPPICSMHEKEIFGAWIELRARHVARELLAAERVADRKRREDFAAWQASNYPDEARGRRALSEPVRLRKGAHLNEQDNALLSMLRGAA